MFEIWRHILTGRRYRVVSRNGRATAAAGPLPEFQDPAWILEQHGNQDHNPHALLDMRKSPGNYAREYYLDPRGKARPFPDQPDHMDDRPERAWVHDGAGRTFVLGTSDLDRFLGRKAILAHLLREGLAEEVDPGGGEPQTAPETGPNTAEAHSSRPSGPSERRSRRRDGDATDRPRRHRWPAA
jgi:hypothetical protein